MRFSGIPIDRDVLRRRLAAADFCQLPSGGNKSSDVQSGEQAGEQARERAPRERRGSITIQFWRGRFTGCSRVLRPVLTSAVPAAARSGPRRGATAGTSGGVQEGACRLLVMAMILNGSISDVNLPFLARTLHNRASTWYGVVRQGRS